MRKLTKKSQFAVPTLPEIKRALRIWIVNHEEDLEAETGLSGGIQEVISAMMLRWLELSEPVAWAELTTALVRLRERMESEPTPIVRGTYPVRKATGGSSRALSDRQSNGADQHQARRRKVTED